MDQQYRNQANQGGPEHNRNLDEKYCQSCGEIIRIGAEICPKCGARQKGMINKAALLLFTFFLGGLGAHKFYTGRNLQGVLYVLFCWTGIPALISLIEFIIYALTSSERLNEKYQSSGSALVIACVAAGVGIIYLTCILAAIAIPQFILFRDRAYQAAFDGELQSIITAENVYFLENNKYSSDVTNLCLTPGIPYVDIAIIGADENCFEARVTHTKLHKSVLIDCKGLKQSSDE
jgi:TM2 domain-containing membrane protein YozV